MKNILEELWYGNIIPMEHSVGGNAHIKKLINLMGKNREKLSETLNDSQKELLARYDDAVNEMVCVFDKRRKLMKSLLDEVMDVAYVFPQGAFYVDGIYART